ncbi:hypothetical protein [Microcoleus sp. AT9b-C5]
MSGWQQHYTIILTEIAIFLGNGRSRRALARATAFLREEPPAGRLFHK